MTPLHLAGSGPDIERAIRIPVGHEWRDGDLVVPAGAKGLVIFAHGSGSNRLSIRNKAVAAHLRASGLATLLTDLLTRQEEVFDARTAALRFDIPLLGERVLQTMDAVREVKDVAGLPVGLFGASTGGAAALVAAAGRTEQVRAVVSRGGRPDLAGRALPRVRAATLLIVGGDDHEVLRLNEDALARLTCEKALEVVPGASHLFEEPGTLDIVAELAARWFDGHLTAARAMST